jgi:hypothetical protein
MATTKNAVEDPRAEKGNKRHEDVDLTLFEGKEPGKQQKGQRAAAKPREKHQPPTLSIGQPAPP